MKKILTFALAAFMMTACSQKKAAMVVEQDENPTTIVWIEDKPGPTMLERKVFPNVPDSVWASLGLQDGVLSSVSCFLLQTDGKTILVDAGLGAPISRLSAKLAEQGVKPDSLRLIYLTHLHPDHIGGMLQDGQPVFPNAEVYVNRVEAEAWKAMNNEQSALAKAMMEAYKDHLHLFEAGDTLQGGVQTIEAYGHTPGHTLFQKDNILIVGDLIHGADLQLPHPEICPFFDMDPKAATETRIRVLDYAHKNHLTMYGMHLPSPGYIE